MNKKQEPTFLSRKRKLTPNKIENQPNLSVRGAGQPDLSYVSILHSLQGGGKQTRIFSRSPVEETSIQKKMIRTARRQLRSKTISRNNQEMSTSTGEKKRKGHKNHPVIPISLQNTLHTYVRNGIRMSVSIRAATTEPQSRPAPLSNPNRKT